ncbi:MAG: hypothetical protein HKL90_12880 [Elusimicrobia bacterium]|nr:hypothetical protein [Elusimicrobiota bacterium]
MLKRSPLVLAAVALIALAGATVTAPDASSISMHYSSFLPPNNLQNRISAQGAGGLTQDQYNAVIDRMVAIYGPLIAAQGDVLVINRLWSDDTVNSSAERNGNQYIINAYGGLARDKTITQDGEALVLCHEMGHNIGGAPKYPGDWASDEGEADYFATTKCLHRIFADASTAQFTHSLVGADGNMAFARAACAQSYKSAADQAVCARSAQSGLSVTALFQELSGDPVPHFNTPDPSVVTQTFDDHPGTQCRLDTYFQGALCTKAYTVDMDDNDPAVGACVASQGYTVGLRPRCWYMPPPSEPSLTLPVASAAPARQTPSLAALRSADPFSGL